MFYLFQSDGDILNLLSNFLLKSTSNYSRHYHCYSRSNQIFPFNVRRLHFVTTFMYNFQVPGRKLSLLSRTINFVHNFSFIVKTKRFWRLTQNFDLEIVEKPSHTTHKTAKLLPIYSSVGKTVAVVKKSCSVLEDNCIFCV